MDRIVLGGSDGAIEAVAMTAALNGGGLEFGTILLAGFAFAIAGALSMFFSSYLSRKSELDSLRADIAREKMEIEMEPEEEKAELESLLRAEGYTGDEVGVIMGRLVKNKEMWLREQLRRELRLHPEELESDTLAGPAAAGTAFFLLALVAIGPYALFSAPLSALMLSVTATLAALFVLGSRAFLPKHFNPVGGLESVAVGAVAAGILYGVGLFVARL